MTTNKPQEIDMADTTAEIGVPRDALWCENDQREVSESEAETLYECGSCSDVSTERRCDSCNKFKARSEEVACPDCEEPVTEAQVTTDYDGETILFEDFVEGGESHAVRDAAQREADAAERPAKEAADKEKRLTNSAGTTWGEIAVGDVITLVDVPKWDTPLRYVGYRHDLPDGTVLVALHGSSYRLHTFDAAEPVLVSTDTEAIEVATRYATEDNFAGHTRVPDGDVDHASSPSKRMMVEVGHAPKDGALLPAIEINSLSGNMLGRIAVLFDPEIAVSILDTLDAAVADLAAQQGVTIDTAAVADRIEVREDAGWVSSEFDRPFIVKVGANSWDRDMGTILNIRAGSNITFADPSVLAAGLAEARARLDHLTMIPKVIG
jgi:hypothetical protein